MSNMVDFEFEKYFLVENLSELDERLLVNRFTKSKIFQQENFYFDTPNFDFLDAQRRLRVRKNYLISSSGELLPFECELSFSSVSFNEKTRIEDREQKSMEINGSEADILMFIFKSMGFLNSFLIEKKRRFYSNQEIQFELDKDIIVKKFPKYEPIKLEDTIQITLEGNKRIDLLELNKKFTKILLTIGIDPEKSVSLNYFERCMRKIEEQSRMDLSINF